MYKHIKDFIQRRKLLFGITLWAGLYLTINYFNVQRNREAYFSNPIVYKTEENFLHDLELEKQKLGLRNINISCEDDKSIQGGHCFRKGEGRYLIKFNPAHKSERVLRHELYHIKKFESFSLDDLLDGILFGGYEEWRATTYSLQE
jgi:hypothetical protein